MLNSGCGGDVIVWHLRWRLGVSLVLHCVLKSDGDLTVSAELHGNCTFTEQLFD